MITNPDELPKTEWQEACFAITLHETEQLQVKLETIHGCKSELLHHHQHTEQVFFILNGTANFELDRKFHQLGKGSFISVPAGLPHRIINQGNDTLEFIVISSRPAHTDRVNYL